MTPPSVAVAVLTYRRPDDLRELLPQLVAQATASSADVEVLVVDNDPDAGAGPLVRGTDLVRYVHEPVPGIAAARNRAIEESIHRDVLVYIDDDERPSEGWLDLLLDAWRAHGSAAVAGPVISRYAVEPDPWITAGRFFERRRLPTGTALELVATNNLLLDLRQLDRFGTLRFDPRYGLSGGSDTLFSRQLVRRGGSMTWCDEAIVYDIVPEARLSRRWVLHRAFRMGNTWMRTSVESTPGRLGKQVVRVRLIGAGLLRVAGGGAGVAVGLATGRVGYQARGMRTAARGIGLVAASVGFVYSEYRRA